MTELTDKKKKSLKLARQALGIVNKVIEMIEKDRYCPEIIQQIEAVIGLITSAEKELLEGHLDHCLEHKLKENKEKAIEELLKIYKLTR